jgi:hypothetical protein
VTTDGGLVEIEHFVEVPGQDEPLSVLVPLHEGDWAGEPSQIEVGADVEVMGEQLTEELGAGADDWQAALREGYQLPSSLVRPADQWQVTGIDQVPGEEARVVFGRRGLHEMGIRLPSESLVGVNSGDTIMGTEVIWEGGGFLWLGRARVEFVPDPDPPAPIPIMVPVMRLHRPRPEGCQASYIIERGNSQGADMTVEVLGLGAGGGFKAGVRVTSEYTACTACVETVIPAKYQLVPGKTMVNGTEVSWGFRAKLFDPEPDKKETRPVSAADDDCERSLDALAGLVQLPKPLGLAPKGDHETVGITFENETHGKLSVGLAMSGTVPFKLGVDYQRSIHQQTTIRTKLAAGVNYIAYAPRSRATGTPGEQPEKLLKKELEICWTTQV